MNVAWTHLAEELDAWARAGRTATLWWRDDDAASVDPALRRLLALSARAGVPVTLAVVPARTDAALGRLLADAPLVDVAQHGWTHRNHAPAGEKAMELGPHRPASDVLDEIRRGRDVLEELFPKCFRPILVPPWNRIDPALLPELPGLGFRVLSAFAAHDASGEHVLARADTHVDIVDWRGTRGFRGVEYVLAATVEHLRARREERVDPEEVTGLLTHHLDHDEPCWQFVDAFLCTTVRHRAVRWISGAEAARA